MAAYDLPATVDKILAVTGAQQLFYVGHSQGGEIAFAQLSRDQDLASKIKLFVGLAPATYCGNAKSPLRFIAPFARDLEASLKPGCCQMYIYIERICSLFPTVTESVNRSFVCQQRDEN